tara:strand:+ start:56 stop:265 length:210 start_codon:yes stop_codon:yes gene_type:complete
MKQVVHQEIVKKAMSRPTGKTITKRTQKRRLAKSAEKEAARTQKTKTGLISRYGTQTRNTKRGRKKTNG